MIIKPTVDDLLEGVARNLTYHLLPELADRPHARDVVVAALGVLDRIGSEWDSRRPAVEADNEDLLESLARIVRGLGTKDPEIVDRVRDLAARRPSTTREAAELNLAAKSVLTRLIRTVGLPTADTAPPEVLEADRDVFALLRRITEREIGRASCRERVSCCV